MCCFYIALYIYCPLKITQHTPIIVKLAGNKSEYTLTGPSSMMTTPNTVQVCTLTTLKHIQV